MVTTAVAAAIAPFASQFAAGAGHARTAEDSDSGIDAARVFIITALSKAVYVEIGIDTLANRHLFHDASLFIQTSFRRLKSPLLVEGVTGTVECWVVGSVNMDGNLIRNVYLCPSSPVNILSFAQLTKQYPQWKISASHDAIRMHDSHGSLVVDALNINGLYIM